MNRNDALRDHGRRETGHVRRHRSERSRIYITSAMRITRALLGNGRRPQSDNVPFRQSLPIELRPYVRGKGSKSTEVACLFEMSLVFACMKAKEFSEADCEPQISAFKRCYDNSLEQKRERKRNLLRGEIVPGQQKMEYQQINRVLKMFPPLSKPKTHA